MTWEQLAVYAAEEWVPPRIAFGRHKGRSIAEARTDAGLRRWLDGLLRAVACRSSGKRANAEGHPLFPLVAGAASHGASRDCAACGRGIELEIIRVLEAGHALRESPDYELHRLTTQTPALFDETVNRHVES